MFSIDEYGCIEVEIDGQIVRRRAEMRMDAGSSFGDIGGMRGGRAVPVLRGGEMLIEMIGRPPMIVPTKR
jgi:hypothetical protein